MPIVNSTIVDDSPQRDGRRWVRERHTDHDAQIHEVLYMAEVGANATTAMTARVAQIEAQLASHELENNIGQIDRETVAPLTPVIRLRHSTVEQLGAAIRQRFQAASGLRAALIAEWLLSLTDAQLRNLFSMTQAQVTSLKTRLTAKVTILTNLRNTVGE